MMENNFGKKPVSVFLFSETTEESPSRFLSSILNPQHILPNFKLVKLVVQFFRVLLSTASSHLQIIFRPEQTKVKSTLAFLRTVELFL